MRVCWNTQAFQRARQTLSCGPVRLGGPAETLNPLTISIAVKIRSPWPFFFVSASPTSCDLNRKGDWAPH